MKRFLVLALTLVLLMSLSSAAYAEPSKVGYGILEESSSGAVVRVMVDLSDNLSVGFHPMAFYIFDQPAYNNDGDYLAFGTLLSEKSYGYLFEAHTDSERTEKDGYIVLTEPEGDKTFVAPVGEGLYIMLIVDSAAADAEGVLAHVSYELEDYNFADPVQMASGVIADSMDKDMLVDVTIDLSYGWSARFLPGAFYLYNEDTVDEDYEVYGTLLNKTDYDLIMESHANDETLHEQNGVLMYKTDSYTGMVAPVAENEYITLIVYGIYDPEAMWERLTYKLF